MKESYKYLLYLLDVTGKWAKFSYKLSSNLDCEEVLKESANYIVTHLIETDRICCFMFFKGDMGYFPISFAYKDDNLDGIFIVNALTDVFYDKITSKTLFNILRYEIDNRWKNSKDGRNISFLQV